MYRRAGRPGLPAEFFGNFMQAPQLPYNTTERATGCRGAKTLEGNE